MSLEDLLNLSSDELYERVKEREVPGRGSMSKADKIAALADPPLSKETQELLTKKKGELYQIAKDQDVDGYSQLDKDGLILALADDPTPSETPDSEEKREPSGSRQEERRKALVAAAENVAKRGEPYAIYESFRKNERDAHYFYTAPLYMEMESELELIAEIHLTSKF